MMTNGYIIESSFPYSNEGFVAVYNYSHINLVQSIPFIGQSLFITKNLIGLWKIKQFKNKQL